MYKVGDKVQIEGEVTLVDHIEGDDYRIQIQTVNGTEIWVRDKHLSVPQSPRRGKPVLKDGDKE